MVQSLMSISNGKVDVNFQLWGSSLIVGGESIISSLNPSGRSSCPYFGKRAMSNSLGNGDTCLIGCAVFVCTKCVSTRDWREWPASSQNHEINGISLFVCFNFRKPLPLTTVELQKQGARFLRMSSAQIMKVYRLRSLSDTDG